MDENGFTPWPAAAHGVSIHKGRLHIFGGYSTMEYIQGLHIIIRMKKKWETADIISRVLQWG